MELFERVRLVLDSKRITKSGLARLLNIPQPTLNSYFSAEKQEKLLPCLYQILELWPDISRDWLFFGDGEMTEKFTRADEAVLKKELADTREELAKAKSELKAEQDFSHKLVAKMLLQDANPGDTENDKKPAM